MCTLASGLCKLWPDSGATLYRPQAVPLIFTVSVIKLELRMIVLYPGEFSLCCYRASLLNGMEQWNGTMEWNGME